MKYLNFLIIIFLAQPAWSIFNKFKIFNQCYRGFQITTPPPAKTVALTFDDGPNEHTEFVLEVLKKNNIQATFFVLGKMAETNTHILKRMWADGHIVANHSWTHTNFHDLYERGVREEIMRTQEFINPWASKPAFFRYPYGNSTCAAEKVLGEMSLINVGWHVDSCDYTFGDGLPANKKSAQDCGVPSSFRNDPAGFVLKNILKKDGGIVLFHDVYRQTGLTLEILIPKLKQAGFTFKKLDSKEYTNLLIQESRIIKSKAR